MLANLKAQDRMKVEQSYIEPHIQIYINHPLYIRTTHSHKRKIVHIQQEEEEVKIRPQSSLIDENKIGWKDLMLRNQLMKSIKEAGFIEPSDVQRQGIMEILKGCNLICQAKSGTGKTGVYLISILQLIQLREDNTYLPHQCLVMVPTRQLAHQILKQFLHFSKYFTPKIPISAFFGGVSIESNVTQLCEGSSPAIIISTPGRLNDLNQRNYIIMHNCKYFILDECDKVLQNTKMRADFWNLHQKITKKHQLLMFSATISPQVLIQTRKYMVQPLAQVRIQEDTSVLDRLTQFFIRAPEINKYQILQHLLDSLAFNQCIIFVNRIDKAKKLKFLLNWKLYNSIEIHSSLRQQERILNYDLFKQKCSKILVATDLFGRGIDIEKVNLVINYDFPRDSETYLHRVGRAGRFGHKGLAISFLRIDDNEGVNGPFHDDHLMVNLKKQYNIMFQVLPQKIDTTDYL